MKFSVKHVFKVSQMFRKWSSSLRSVVALSLLFQPLPWRAFQLLPYCRCLRKHLCVDHYLVVMSRNGLPRHSLLRPHLSCRLLQRASLSAWKNLRSLMLVHNWEAINLLGLSSGTRRTLVYRFFASFSRSFAFFFSRFYSRAFLAATALIASMFYFKINY